MRSFLIRSVLFVAAGCLASPATAVAQDDSPVQGAWIITSLESPDGTVNTSVQPALYLFTSTHYSTMIATSDEPRARFAGEEATDAERLEAYGSFVANSGRYEISGDEITTRAYVAKNPNYMGDWPDNASTYAFAVDGDQLQLTFENGFKITLRHVEGMTMPDDE